MTKSLADKFFDRNPGLKSAVMGVVALGVAAATAMGIDGHREERKMDVELPHGGDDDTYAPASEALEAANDMLLDGFAELQPMYQEIRRLAGECDHDTLAGNMERIRDLATELHLSLEEQVDEALAYVAMEADEDLIDRVTSDSIVHNAEMAAQSIEVAVVRNDVDALRSAIFRLNNAYDETDRAYDERSEMRA